MYFSTATTGNAASMIDVYFNRILFSKTWHLVGTIFILAAFPLFFPTIGVEILNCYRGHTEDKLSQNESNKNITSAECSDANEQIITAYYSIFAGLWGLGYAMIKTAHFSLIPIITSKESTKITLTSIRYAADVVSKLCLYGTAWALFHTGQ